METRASSSRALSLLQGLSLAIASDSTICAALSEAGVVYAELESFYSSQQHRGVVRQALASSVRSHLDLYLRDLASVEAEIARTEKLANEGDSKTSTLWTIRRLSAWLSRTIARLRALQRIVRSTDSCVGVHIATSVWGCCMTGDPLAKEVAVAVFAAVARPFGLACRNWIRGATPVGVPLLRSSHHSSLSGSTDDFFVRDTTPFTPSSLADITGSSLSEEEEENLTGSGGPRLLLKNGKKQRISLGRWGDSSVDMRLIPAFLSTELALEIFSCGRTLRFLQQVCGDDMWVASLGRKLRQADEHAAAIALLKATASASSNTQKDSAGMSRTINRGSHVSSSSSLSSSHAVEGVGGGNSLSSRYFSPTSLNNALQEAHVLGPIGSQRLLQLLKGKFSLLQHLAAVHRYVFLTQGDFVTSLVASISSEISRPAALVSSSKHVLDGIFETAVRATNAHLDDRAVLDRVIVTLLPLPTMSGAAGGFIVKTSDNTQNRSKGGGGGGGGKFSGWDVFCLEYAFDEPISSIVDSNCQVRCGAIFSFLWLLRRCEHELTKAWREQAEVHHSIRGSPDSRVLVEALHKSHLLRSEIASFVKTLLSHAMFDVLAPAWTQLHQSIENASGMDDLIQAYGTYLDAIVEGLFLQLASSTTTTLDPSSSTIEKVHNRAETQASRAISRILRVALDYTEIQRRQSLLILSAVESKPIHTLDDDNINGDGSASSGSSKGRRSKRIVSAVADVKVLAEALVSHAEALEVITVDFRQSVKELFSLSSSSEISTSSAERLEAIEARYDSKGFNNYNALSTL